MKPSPASGGDLGEFIVAELNKRGITVSTTGGSPSLPATWRVVTVKIVGAPKDVGVEAQGCSLADACAFCFSLFSGLRVHRPFSNDNDERFFFTIAGGSASFARTSTGLVVSFIKLGVMLTVAGSENGLHVGLADHPPVSNDR